MSDKELPASAHLSRFSGGAGPGRSPAANPQWPCPAATAPQPPPAPCCSLPQARPLPCTPSPALCILLPEASAPRLSSPSSCSSADLGLAGSSSRMLSTTAAEAGRQGGGAASSCPSIPGQPGQARVLPGSYQAGDWALLIHLERASSLRSCSTRASHWADEETEAQRGPEPPLWSHSKEGLGPSREPGLCACLTSLGTTGVAAGTSRPGPSWVAGASMGPCCDLGNILRLPQKFQVYSVLCLSCREKSLWLGARAGSGGGGTCEPWGGRSSHSSPPLGLLGPWREGPRSRETLLLREGRVPVSRLSSLHVHPLPLWASISPTVQGRQNRHRSCHLLNSEHVRFYAR